MSTIVITRYSDTGFCLEALKTLFREYNNFIQINLDFQDFDTEMSNLPGKYAHDKGGCLYLVYVDDSPIGCAGLYKLNDKICEIKRVFVSPHYQGKGIGRMIMETAISDGKKLGYDKLYLDSLHRLEAAKQLYLKLGFQEILPYNENPHPDVYYMSLDLKPPNVG
jgi:putative acetyltransferase